MGMWLFNILFSLTVEKITLSHHHRKTCMKQKYKEHTAWINLLPLNLRVRDSPLNQGESWQRSRFPTTGVLFPPSNQRYENEHSFKRDLEIEVEGLRKTLDDLTIITTDLEQDVEGMRKELILMKKRHEKVGLPRSHQHSSSFTHFNSYRRNPLYASAIVLQPK